MKKIIIRITGNAKVILFDLRSKDKLTRNEEKLLRSIEQRISFLKKDVEYGIHIEKKKIPKKLIDEFGVSNLFKINLVNYWRMLYTLKGNEVEIIALILEIVDHKDYDKIMNYRGRK